MQLAPSDPVLSPQQAEPFLNQISDWTCSCGRDLHGLPIYRYPHDAGWKVSGIIEPQWLYIHCPKCDYDLAIWKLGIPR